MGRGSCQAAYSALETWRQEWLSCLEGLLVQQQMYQDSTTRSAIQSCMLGYWSEKCIPLPNAEQQLGGGCFSSCQITLNIGVGNTPSQGSYLKRPQNRDTEVSVLLEASPSSSNPREMQLVTCCVPRMQVLRLRKLAATHLLQAVQNGEVGKGSWRISRCKPSMLVA